MTRILHVIDSLDLGGAQTALLNLLTSSDRQEFYHEVAAMHGRGMFANEFESAGIPVHSLSAHRLPPAYLWRFPALLKRGRFDVVHCHLFGANWIAKPTAFFMGCRCLYNHDQCNDAFRSDSRIVTWIDSAMNRFSTRVLTVSHSITRFLLEAESISEEKLTYLPNSVDLERFHPATNSERILARKLFGIPADATIIGAVGRLTAQKQFETFVRSAGILRERHPDWVFVLFGSGPDELPLRHMASELGDSFRFVGATPHRAAIYHALDVQVLTSKFEGLPMTILEGMASGVPVVASRVDGVMEVVTDRENALLVDPGDTAGFAGAIEEILSPSPVQEQLRKSARALVEQNFDSKVLSKRLHALYKMDLGRRRQGGT
jgi:glycosyltransferase involved in cell wall biosynthesis